MVLTRSHASAFSTLMSEADEALRYFLCNRPEFPDGWTMNFAGEYEKTVSTGIRTFRASIGQCYSDDAHGGISFSFCTHLDSSQSSTAEGVTIDVDDMGIVSRIREWPRRSSPTCIDLLSCSNLAPLLVLGNVLYLEDFDYDAPA